MCDETRSRSKEIVMQRVLICGDRNFGSCPHHPVHQRFADCPAAMADRQSFVEAMRKWSLKHGQPTLVIEGCARGADTMAEHWAKAQDIEIAHYPAQWERFGRSAGPKRNQQMLLEGKPEAVIAFHRNLAASKGTGHMVRTARAASVPVWVAIKQGERS